MMLPAGRVPSNFGHHGGPHCNMAVIFHSTLMLTVLLQTSVLFVRRGVKKSIGKGMGEHGWSNDGRRGRDRGGQRRGSASTTLEVSSNF